MEKAVTKAHQEAEDARNACASLVEEGEALREELRAAANKKIELQAENTIMELRAANEKKNEAIAAANKKIELQAESTIVELRAANEKKNEAIAAAAVANEKIEELQAELAEAKRLQKT